MRAPLSWDDDLRKTAITLTLAFVSQACSLGPCFARPARQSHQTAARRSLPTQKRAQTQVLHHPRPALSNPAYAYA